MRTLQDRYNDLMNTIAIVRSCKPNEVPYHEQLNAIDDLYDKHEIFNEFGSQSTDYQYLKRSIDKFVKKHTE